MKKFEDIINLKGTMNRENYNKLKMDVEKNHISPFVGSGMSMPIYKTWKDTLKIIKEVSHLDQKQMKEINMMLKKNQLITCASKLAEYMGESVFLDKLCSCFDKNKIDEKKLNKMAVSILPQIFTKKIVTTNYDCILENVYRDINVRYNIVIKKRVSHELDREIRNDLIQPLLIKIHGTVDEEESIVIREEDYNEIYSDKSATTSFLRSLFASNSFLFLGCSLSDDVFCDLLKEEKLLHQNHHYVIIEAPKYNNIWNSRERELNSMGISPIWYPNGEHEYVKIILKQLLKDINNGNKHALNKQGKSNKPNNIVAIQELNNLQQISKIEVEQIVDSMFDDFTNAQKLERCLVPQTLFYDEYLDNDKVNIDDLYNEIKSNKKQKSYIIVGNPGLGKTIAISYLNRKLLEKKSRKVILLTKATFKYMCNKKGSNLTLDVKRTLDALLNKDSIFNKSRSGVYILIESMEEIVLNKHNAQKVLNQLIRNGYTIIVGTRNINLEDTRKMFTNDISCLYLFQWNDEEIKMYIEKRYQAINEKIIQLSMFLKKNQSIYELMHNPFYASLISCLFIIKKESEMIKLNNIYNLYNQFYNAWVQRELNKFNNIQLDRENIFEIHYYIASKIYKKGDIGDIEDILKKFNIVNNMEAKEVIGSILKYDNSNSQIGNKQIVGFFHDTFVEFILVKKIVNTIIYNPTNIKNIFPIDFKHFNVKFFENAIQTLTMDEEEKYRNNLINIYYYLLTDSEKQNFQKYNQNEIIDLYDIEWNFKNQFEKDKVKNSIIYCYGKVRGRVLRKKPKFLIYVYKNEANIRVRICAALAAIKHKLFLLKAQTGITYEEDFLYRIKYDISWNRAIRSIALVFWQDERKGDILSYIDDNGKWEQTKKRNLKRIYNMDDKSKRTRVLDLTLLYIFYDSRGWEDFDLESFQLITKCKFVDYPNDKKLVEEIKNLFNEKKNIIFVNS